MAASPDHFGRLAVTSLVGEREGLDMSWCEPLEPRRLLAAAVTDTLIAAGSTWHYLDTGAAPAAAWTAQTFDDSAWKSGPAQLGYGDGDEATVVSFGPSAANKFITTYFRRSFPATEIRRYAAPVSNLSVTTAPSSTSTAAKSRAQHAFRRHLPLHPRHRQRRRRRRNRLLPLCPPPRRSPSANTLAVEIHQNLPTSADVSFDLRLTATRTPPTPPPSPSSSSPTPSSTPSPTPPPSTPRPSGSSTTNRPTTSSSSPTSATSCKTPPPAPTATSSNGPAPTKPSTASTPSSPTPSPWATTTTT